MNQIAALTFSSRSTVVKYLRNHGIILRPIDRHGGTLQFGKRRKGQQIIDQAREQAAIEKAKFLRNQGLSFDKIAQVMNAMNIKTRSGKSSWYAKTVRSIILR